MSIKNLHICENGSRWVVRTTGVLSLSWYGLLAATGRSGEPAVEEERTAEARVSLGQENTETRGQPVKGLLLGEDEEVSQGREVPAVGESTKGPHI